jgi:hypothetical protein
MKPSDPNKKFWFIPIIVCTFGGLKIAVEFGQIENERFVVEFRIVGESKINGFMGVWKCQLIGIIYSCLSIGIEYELSSVNFISNYIRHQ